jgi:hypothetical protein
MIPASRALPSRIAELVTIQQLGGTPCGVYILFLSLTKWW